MYILQNIYRTQISGVDHLPPMMNEGQDSAHLWKASAET